MSIPYIFGKTRYFLRDDESWKSDEKVENAPREKGRFWFKTLGQNFSGKSSLYESLN